MTVAGFVLFRPSRVRLTQTAFNSGDRPMIRFVALRWLSAALSLSLALPTVVATTLAAQSPLTLAVAGRSNDAVTLACIDMESERGGMDILSALWGTDRHRYAGAVRGVP